MSRHSNVSGKRLHRVSKTNKMSPSEPKPGTRSKNGCLTCRRRHVKCGEAKPVCRECTKQRTGCHWAPPPLPKDQQPEEAAQEPQARPFRLLARASEKATTSLAVNYRHNGLAPFQGPTWVPDNETMMNDTPLSPDFLMGLSSFDFPFLPCPPVPCPEPTMDLQLSSNGLLAPLPLAVSPAETEREAFAFYRSEKTFGFGSAKNPNYSTHAVLWETSRENKAVLHLLLAATQAEMASQREFPGSLLDHADENYRLGRQLLEEEVRRMDPVHAMACFYFLYLHHKRRQSAGHRIQLGELSEMMEGYVTAFKLHQLPSSCDPNQPAWSQAKKALMARLMIWLFWVDAQAAAGGQGGKIAKLLTSPGCRRALTDLYETSRSTQVLFWAESYPDDELVDDIKNWGALDMIHDTWVLVQETNNAADEVLPLDVRTSNEIQAKIESLRRKPIPRAVLRLTSSNAPFRDRLMLNADWAGVNLYALCIYHFRCSLTDERLPFSSPGGVRIMETVDSLLLLIQKGLATGRKDQPDRMQWPLFWAGIETTDPFKRVWVLGQLKDEGLLQTLRSVLLLQEGGTRVGMAKIREVFQASCLGVPVAGFGGMWGMRG
ncbi:hypothetical protein QBC40DRAFT_304640 [Triangularia verruculosa]|uniref:Zn(2)-C6 fungal-type domain-containing protein n=1 Tax=Triangularia verruculosa TaxID=2587418 RepID=A0AAN6XLY0_9PEZI|nr:hypothetical protein QBC40DRAFT_304640 [Triangularia verruculosa]